MKVWIDHDEWYPVFTADNGAKAIRYNLPPWGTEMEVTEEQYAEWTRITEEFHKMQQEMKSLMKWVG